DQGGAGLHHGDRDNAVVVPHLGHAQLGTQDALDLPVHFVGPYSLISMSTPAGRSSRMSESTVFGVGSMMSIRRLCVRISKCSRESLYLCGDRMTQYTFFSVGSGTGPATRAPVRVTVSTIFRAELSMTSWSYALSRMRIFCPAIWLPYRLPLRCLRLTFPGTSRGGGPSGPPPTCYLTIFVTRPAPTVRPPSRIAKRRPSSMAIGWISSTFISVLSPGITISVPSGRLTTPVTSGVRK